MLLIELKKSDTFGKFYSVFINIYKDKVKRDDPLSYLDFECSLKKYIDANPKHTADTKAKAAQYFTILNRIEYVITIDAKYSEQSFLLFWRKFNALYNTINRNTNIKDPIEVYFDNKIGIIEVATEDAQEKKKKATKVAEGHDPYAGNKFDILAIIAARNEHEAKTGQLIADSESKIKEFFDYIPTKTEGSRLIIKMKSHVSESEIYEEFAKIYRNYRAIHRKKVGEYFFKEMDDLVNKLCDDFETYLYDEV